MKSTNASNRSYIHLYSLYSFFVFIRYIHSSYSFIILIIFISILILYLFYIHYIYHIHLLYAFVIFTIFIHRTHRFHHQPHQLVSTTPRLAIPASSRLRVLSSFPTHSFIHPCFSSLLAPASSLMVLLPEVLLVLTLSLIAYAPHSVHAKSRTSCVQTGDETEINRLLDWGQSANLSHDSFDLWFG